MDATETTKPRTCRRCNGSGEYRGYGLCYGCQGHGVIHPVVVDTTPDPEYAATLAHRERRAAERRARREARDV